MAKLNSKKLIKLIENLVDKKIESEVERRVDERVKELVPMLTEHEVKRLLREMENDVHTSPQHQKSNSTGNKVADDVISETDTVQSKQQLRERFSRMIGSGNIKRDSDGGKTISFDSSDVGPNHHPRGAKNGVNSLPETNPDGERIDTSNPNVQKVANIMNQDFSDKLKEMRERSKKRGGQIPQGGQPAGGN